MISEATNTFFLNFKSEWDNVVPICKSLEALESAITSATSN
jgi:hypothetical protein